MCTCDKCGIRIKDSLCDECRNRLLEKHAERIDGITEAQEEADFINDLREAGL